MGSDPSSWEWREERTVGFMPILILEKPEQLMGFNQRWNRDFRFSIKTTLSTLTVYHGVLMTYAVIHMFSAAF